MSGQVPERSEPGPGAIAPLSGAARDAAEAAAAALAPARSILFVTGAGISADSGLPTYRGVAGLYEREATPDGMAIEEALSGPMMRRRPEIVWRYVGEVVRACRGARPNRAHAVIAELEQSGRRVCVLTQNVDGLHLAAGSRDVIEIHGTVARRRCMDCTHVWPAPGADDGAPSGDDGGAAVPRCPACGGVARPDVVLFGERLPDGALDALDRALRLGFNAVVVVGTSAAFPYVQLPVIEAARAGATTVEINPERTVLSDVVGHHVAAGAAAALHAMGGVLAPSRP